MINGNKLVQPEVGESEQENAASTEVEANSQDEHAAQPEVPEATPQQEVAANTTQEAEATAEVARPAEAPMQAVSQPVQQAEQPSEANKPATESVTSVQSSEISTSNVCDSTTDAAQPSLVPSEGITKPSEVLVDLSAVSTPDVKPSDASAVESSTVTIEASDSSTKLPSEVASASLELVADTSVTTQASTDAAEATKPAEASIQMSASEAAEASEKIPVESAADVAQASSQSAMTNVSSVKLSETSTGLPDESTTDKSQPLDAPIQTSTEPDAPQLPVASAQ